MSARIDWSNPLTKGLKMFAMPTGGGRVGLTERIKDFVTGNYATALTVGDGAVVVDSVEGFVFQSTSARYSISIGTHGVGTGPYTMVCRFNDGGSPTPTYQTLMSLQPSDVGFYTYAGSDRMGIDSNDMGTTGFAPNWVATTNEWRTYAYSIAGSGTNAQGYEDGVKLGVTALPVIYSSQVGIGSVELMTGQGGEAGNGKASWWALYNRVLSDSEHAALHANPWQLFEPLSVPVMVPVYGIDEATGLPIITSWTPAGPKSDSQTGTILYGSGFGV